MLQDTSVVHTGHSALFDDIGLMSDAVVASEFVAHESKDNCWKIFQL